MYFNLGLLAAAVLGAEAATWNGLPEDHATRVAASGIKPNIIFIILDDLDGHMSKLQDTIPSLKKNIVDQGTTLSRHYCTVSLCCPARASILTGQNAHNHNVTDVAYPNGGYPKFHDNGYNDNYLPIWLQNGGYNTYYIGKLLNEITVDNWNTLPLNGWTGIDSLLDPFAYSYFNPSFGRNGEAPIHHTNEYVTDLVSNKSMAYLDEALKSDKPFFLGIAPNAPHSELYMDVETQTGYELPPKPAPRHKGYYANDVVPRGPNFNPNKPSGASWVKKLNKLNQTEVDFGDEWQRGRLESLLSVNEMIDELFMRLEKAAILDNTYIIFTSDNGFHISQHRLPPGKTCGYEEDINVPFYIRGPGIAKNQVLDIVSAHVDIAPTILDIAGIPQKSTFDGRPMPLTKQALDAQTQPWTEQATVEMWRSSDTGGFNISVTPNNTYKSIRLHSEKFNLYYSVWCTNEHELYDMSTDPQQMKNFFDLDNETQIYPGVTVSRLGSRLDALLYVLKSCRADSCRFPWNSLMPGKGVNNLSDALDPKHDSFFDTVPIVSFSSCKGGYILSAEGPQFETWPAKRTFSETNPNLYQRSWMSEYLLLA